MSALKVVEPGRADIVRVETPLGMVLVHVGLKDEHGHAVETVEIVAKRTDGGLGHVHNDRIIGAKPGETTAELKAVLGPSDSDARKVIDEILKKIHAPDGPMWDSYLVEDIANTLQKHGFKAPT